MSSPVESYTNTLTFVSACRILRDQVGGLLNCVSLGIDVKAISLDGPHAELRRVLSHHEAYPDTLRESDFTEAMFAFRKLYHLLAEKGGSDYAHPEPYYNSVFRICANVHRKRNNIPIVLITTPAPTGVKRRRAKVIKSVETVDSDSEVEVMTAPAAVAAPAAPVTAVAVPAATVSVADASTHSTDMVVDDTADSVPASVNTAHAAALPIVTRSVAETRPEAVRIPYEALPRIDLHSPSYRKFVQVVARKRVRVDLTFPKFPDVRMWAMNVINSVEGRRFPDKPGQSLSFREAVIAQRSADLLAAATKIEQYVVATKTVNNYVLTAPDDVVLVVLR
ncbi:hypothetical protein BDQ17DRAFT_1439008 [Cyathus striatus]|nr:hypothetical protein BDQ17DRAFT_1439008 [Cyathus striatus]